MEITTKKITIERNNDFELLDAENMTKVNKDEKVEFAFPNVNGELVSWRRSFFKIK